MIMHCSIPKPQLNSHTVQLNANRNKQLEALPPTPGLEKIKNNMPELIALNEDKNKAFMKGDKSQPRQFKIRACSLKGQGKWIACQGKTINNLIPLEIFDKIKNEVKDEVPNIFVKRFQSCNKSSDKNSSMNKEKDIVKNNGKNNQKCMQKIKLFKAVEPTELEFNTVNLEQLLPLSHKAEISLNDFSQQLFNEERKYNLIVSLKLLNQEPKKYKPSHKSHTLNTQSSDSPFSIETTNLLKSLSGSQNSKSFLKHCKLFFKVSSQTQMTTLEDFLILNGYYSYTGIINVQDKYAENMNLYNLKGVVNQDEFLIVMEDRHTLVHEMPVIVGQKTAFLLPKNQTYNEINQMIENFKKIQIHNSSDSGSPSKRSKGSDITEDSDRQNISPNMMVIKVKNSNKKDQLHFEYNSSPTKSSSPSRKISPSKRHSPSKKSQKLKMNGKFCMKALDLNLNKLLQKAKLVTLGKEIRQKTRTSRQNLSRHKDSTQKMLSGKVNREKSMSRERITLNQSSDRIDLEGNFKDKMVTLTKILEAEKRQKLSNKRTTQKLRKFSSKESEEDVIEQLTQNITSKLQFKTPYQMVGELLRNNSHIAKQIGKYIKDISSFEQTHRQTNRKRSTETAQETLCDVMVYDYQ